LHSAKQSFWDPITGKKLYETDLTPDYSRERFLMASA